LLSGRRRSHANADGSSEDADGTSGDADGTGSDADGTGGRGLAPENGGHMDLWSNVRAGGVRDA